MVATVLSYRIARTAPKIPQAAPSVLLIPFECNAPDDEDEPPSDLATISIFAVSPAATTAVFDDGAMRAGVGVIRKPFSSKCFAAVNAAAGWVMTTGKPCSLYLVTTSRPPPAATEGETCGEGTGNGVGKSGGRVDCKTCRQ